MCIVEKFVDVYPDGARREYHQNHFCSRNPNNYFCGDVKIHSHEPRHIQYQELTAGSIISQMPSPRSTLSSTMSTSTAAPIMVEVMEESQPRPRKGKKRQDDFLLSTLFGPREVKKEKREKKERKSRKEGHVTFAHTPPMSPPVPPAVPSAPHPSLSPYKEFTRTVSPGPTGSYGRSLGPQPAVSTPRQITDRNPIIVDARYPNTPYSPRPRSSSTDAEVSTRFPSSSRFSASPPWSHLPKTPSTPASIRNVAPSSTSLLRTPSAASPPMTQRSASPPLARPASPAASHRSYHRRSGHGSEMARATAEKLQAEVRGDKDVRHWKHNSEISARPSPSESRRDKRAVVTQNELLRSPMSDYSIDRLSSRSTMTVEEEASIAADEQRRRLEGERRMADEDRERRRRHEKQKERKRVEEQRLAEKEEKKIEERRQAEKEEKRRYDDRMQRRLGSEAGSSSRRSGTDDSPRRR